MSSARDDEDARRILTRRQLLVAGAMSGASFAAGALAQPRPCLSAPSRAPRPFPFSRAPGRRSTPRERVPAVIRDQLGHQTIYAAGGGQTSVPWRVAVGIDRVLVGAEGDRPGGASYGPLPSSWTTRLPEAELASIVALADRAWREQPTPNLHPTADYDEVLAVRDGDEIFFAQGFGPLRGASGDLVARLRELASAARPARR